MFSEEGIKLNGKQSTLDIDLVITLPPMYAFRNLGLAIRGFAICGFDYSQT